MRKILILFLILFLVGCTTETVVGPDTDTTTNDTTPPADTTIPTPDADDTTDSDSTDADTTDDTATDDTTSTTGTTHTIEAQDDGFEPVELTIAVGDTVVWKNVREDRFTEAFIIGAQGPCKGVTSKETFPPKGFFNPGEEFAHTFEEAGTCIYVDGILTSIQGKIFIE